MSGTIGEKFDIQGGGLDHSWRRIIYGASYEFVYAEITAAYPAAAWVHVIRNGKHVHSFIVPF